MESPLLDIEGHCVTNVTLVHDYAQISFGANVGLSIYNEFSVLPECLNIFDLDGKFVVAVMQSKDRITIFFSENIKIEVDMRSCAYNGPEALQLNRQGEPPVIWN